MTDATERHAVRGGSTRTNVTTDEKLKAIEELIVGIRHDFGRNDPRLGPLKAIAADIRGRLDGKPSVALLELERRMVAVDRSRTFLGPSSDSLIGVAQELMARWPTVKVALEKYGATAEVQQ